MGKFSLWERFRLWLAGVLFALAGRVHAYYDVWIDNAPPRKRRP